MVNRHRHPHPPRRAVVLAVLAAIVADTLVATAPVAASTPSIGIDPTSGPPLTVIKLTGLGYCGPPCGTVSVVIGTLTVQDNVAVDAAGGFASYVRVPGTTRSGNTPVIALQSDSHGGSLTSRTEFNVTPSRPPPTVYPPPATQPPGAGTPPITGSPGPVAPSATDPTTASGTSPPSTQPPTTSTPTASSESQTTTSDTATTTVDTPKVATSSRPADHRSSRRNQLLVALLLSILAAASGYRWWRRRAPSNS